MLLWNQWLGLFMTCFKLNSIIINLSLVELNRQDDLIRGGLNQQRMKMKHHTFEKSINQNKLQYMKNIKARACVHSNNHREEQYSCHGVGGKKIGSSTGGTSSNSRKNTGKHSKQKGWQGVYSWKLWIYSATKIEDQEVIRDGHAVLPKWFTSDSDLVLVQLLPAKIYPQFVQASSKPGREDDACLKIRLTLVSEFLKADDSEPGKQPTGLVNINVGWPCRSKHLS